VYPPSNIENMEFEIMSRREWMMLLGCVVVFFLENEIEFSTREKGVIIAPGTNGEIQIWIDDQYILVNVLKVIKGKNKVIDQCGTRSLVTLTKFLEKHIKPKNV